MSYKLGSLFDGSGGFPLAGSLCGIEPVWASEVEPYPIAVTKSRFPKMKHLGDISKINGAEIDPVDIITFGSPCQDLSVAGKRAGLKHEANGDEETTRSGLFMEAVRIIKEMRRKTNGILPRFAIWENVPGAFSSNKGEDFRVVLEEIIKIIEPDAVMPEVPPKGWDYADCYSGDGWSLAYRVLDAQYWGVPQRRRRIYLVADFRSECAKEILFEREGLRGYFTEGRNPWQTTATDAEGSVGADDREGTCIGVDVYNQALTGEKSMTVTCSATDAHHVPCIVFPEPIIYTRGYGGNVVLDGVSPTLEARAGTGGNNQPIICLQGNGIDRADNAGCNGKGWREDKCYTLNTLDRPAVAYQDKVGSPCAADYKGAGNQYISDNKAIIQEMPNDASHYIVRRLTPTECARLQGFPDRWGDIDYKDDFTDEEYEFWLNVRNNHAEINGKAVKDYTKKQMLTWYNKLGTDSAEYKMWGNGIALPTALYVLQGIEDALSWAEFME